MLKQLTGKPAKQKARDIRVQSATTSPTAPEVVDFALNVGGLQIEGSHIALVLADVSGRRMLPLVDIKPFIFTMAHVLSFSHSSLATRSPWRHCDDPTH
jgi:hypothetical protein